MNFHGREEELAILEQAYAGDGYEGILIYGRRRIGKTELVKESFSRTSARVIYYESKRISEKSNVMSLAEILSFVFSIPVPAFESIEKILDYIFTVAENEKIILVIDEYPYLREKIDGCDSIFQAVIDRHIGRSNIKLILCGSYVDTMVKLTEESNPLFGRLSVKLKIGQLDYYDAAKFYPSFCDRDKVKLYAVFGGVPYYLQFIDSTKSVKENIMELICSKNARLLSESEQLTAGEIRKMSNANEVFMAIAKGYRKFGDILSHSDVSSSPSLADILKKLTDMEIIEKTYPINDEREKKSIYTVADRLTLFYYTYIFRRLSFFSVMPTEDFYDEFVAQDFETEFVPKAYEIIARQFLIRQNQNGKIKPVLYKIGKYYYDDSIHKKNGEFDVVTLDRDGYKFYEVKFTGCPVGQQVVKEELSQIENVGIKSERLGFFSASGFENVPEQFETYNIDEIYYTGG